MLHLVIERSLIQGVAIECVIVRADGHAADGKSEAIDRIEDPVHNRSTFFPVQHRERLPTFFIEAAAEAFNGLAALVG